MPRQPINDGLSRQRRWQINRVREGCCRGCGQKKPADDTRVLCEACTIRNYGTVKRKTTPEQWKAVDWAKLSNAAVARLLDRDPQTVAKARKKYGCPREDWGKQLNPNIPADVQAKQYGKTVRTIYNRLRKQQKPCA